jgi:hypothetical protein
MPGPWALGKDFKNLCRVPGQGTLGKVPDNGWGAVTAVFLPCAGAALGKAAFADRLSVLCRVRHSPSLC